MESELQGNDESASNDPLSKPLGETMSGEGFVPLSEKQRSFSGSQASPLMSPPPGLSPLSPPPGLSPLSPSPGLSSLSPPPGLSSLSPLLSTPKSPASSPPRSRRTSALESPLEDQRTPPMRPVPSLAKLQDAIDDLTEQFRKEDSRRQSFLEQINQMKADVNRRNGLQSPTSWGSDPSYESHRRYNSPDSAYQGRPSPPQNLYEEPKIPKKSASLTQLQDILCDVSDELEKERNRRKQMSDYLCKMKKEHTDLKDYLQSLHEEQNKLLCRLATLECQLDPSGFCIPQLPTPTLLSGQPRSAIQKMKTQLEEKGKECVYQETIKFQKAEALRRQMESELGNLKTQLGINQRCCQMNEVLPSAGDLSEFTHLLDEAIGLCSEVLHENKLVRQQLKMNKNEKTNICETSKCPDESSSIHNRVIELEMQLAIAAKKNRDNDEVVADIRQNYTKQLHLFQVENEELRRKLLSYEMENRYSSRKEKVREDTCCPKESLERKMDGMRKDVEQYVETLKEENERLRRENQVRKPLSLTTPDSECWRNRYEDTVNSCNLIIEQLTKEINKIKKGNQMNSSCCSRSSSLREPKREIEEQNDECKCQVIGLKEQIDLLRKEKEDLLNRLVPAPPPPTPCVDMSTLKDFLTSPKMCQDPALESVIDKLAKIAQELQSSSKPYNTTSPSESAFSRNPCSPCFTFPPCSICPPCPVCPPCPPCPPCPSQHPQPKPPATKPPCRGCKPCKPCPPCPPCPPTSPKSGPSSAPKPSKPCKPCNRKPSPPISPPSTPRLLSTEKTSLLTKACSVTNVRSTDDNLPTDYELGWIPCPIFHNCRVHRIYLKKAQSTVVDKSKLLHDKYPSSTYFQ